MPVFRDAARVDALEQLAKIPIEQYLLDRLAFFDSIQSAAMPGMFSVIVTFEPGPIR